jgi:beta-galactosidase
MRKRLMLLLLLVFLLINVRVFPQALNFRENIYNFIENPAIFEINQVPGHTPMVNFRNTEDAIKNDWNLSPGYLSLNGKWKFSFAETPEEAPKDFHLINFNDSGWDEIPVPSNWQMQGYGHPKFRNIAHPFKSEPPFVPREYNPVGSYRKTFTLPEDWQGQQIYLRFEGIRSASMVWINGNEVGYNQGAFEPSEYDITSLLKPGENQLSVMVIQWSDGTWLEDQDMWRLSGIFRNVYLYAMPKINIRDYYVVTDLDAAYRNATLNIEADIINLTGSNASGYRVRATLYDKNMKQVAQFQSGNVSVPRNSERKIKLSAPVVNPLKWSAEKPNLYSLTLELIRDRNTTVMLSSRVGFRKVEVKNQAILVNGVPVKLNGVNSHMHHPDLGNTMNIETIRRDFELMKQFNINLVRTSHYPPNVEYLQLADEYGIYVVDEAGVEAHATEYLSAREEWKPVYLDRVRKMVLRDRNHPSIIFWSAGNESGWGENLCALIREGRRLDPGRPAWMYGGNADENPATNPIQCEEIVGPRYGTPYELETLFALATESEDPRPSFMDEYLAATGNALGGLDEYWDLIWQYPRLTGGAIWDFVSPGIRAPVRLLTDKSPNQLNVSIQGRSKLENGSIDLTGQDEWVEVYRHPSLDITTNALTLSLGLTPKKWNGTGTYFTKGGNQFGLTQFSPDSLEFYITTNRRNSIRMKLPQNWENNRHHLAGIYDGREMKLFLNGNLVASASCSGNIRNFPFPVNLGKNAEIDGQEWSGYLANVKIDHASVFAKAVDLAALMAADPALQAESLLWLDFEGETNGGEFFSMGIGGRTYGTIWPDRVPQPEMWQVKKSAQPMKAEWFSAQEGILSVTNRFHFTNLNELDAEWILWADDKPVQTGKFVADIQPSKTAKIRIPFTTPEKLSGIEYRLEISFRLKESTIWAPAGHEVAWEQLEIPDQSATLNILPAAGQAPEVLLRDNLVIVKGNAFEYTFCPSRGTIISMLKNGIQYLKEGPETNLFRAPIANELDAWSRWRLRDQQFTQGMGNGVSNIWYAAGIDNLQWKTSGVRHTTTSDNRIKIETEVFAPAGNFGAGFHNLFIYYVDAEGNIELDHTLTPWGVLPPVLQRAGIRMVLPANFSNITWYGRGPHENYPDRKSGAKINVWNTTVAEEYQPYLIPQDHGLKTDTRWVRFEDEQGNGLMFSGDQLFNYSAHIFDADNLARALYPFQLQPFDGITFNYDYSTTGVGCTSFWVFNKYRTPTQQYRSRVFIRPF